MAGPANPFAGLAQNNGTAGSAGGRGRGGPFSRGTPYQAKSTNAAPDFKPRGRGRGAPAARSSRGRGRGAGPGTNTWRKPDSQGAPAGAAASPFAQLKQNTPSPSAFGTQAAQSTPGFSGATNAASSAFGAPSGFAGSMVDSSRDPRRRFPSNQMNGSTGAAVPVENLAVLNSYNDRYEKLKLERAKQREQAIKLGQMADPNQPTSLNQAITPVGTCQSMCPEFERVERIVQKMVDKSEKYLHPATDSLQNMEAKMLKRFRRSAAGYDEQLPSDIRTPKALLQTTNYLIRHVLGGPEPLGLIHKFVWDRTRSIRNDFSVQQLTQEEDVKIAVTCLERIARFHIASLHLLSSPANEEPFDRHQEREQLNNTMLSLMYYYDDNRGRINFPNEDEFRAYYIIFSIHDQRPDLEARVQKWPAELRSSPRVQVALELFAAAGNTWEYQGTLDAKRPNAIAQGFYARFFDLVDSPAVSYMMACVAETYFNHMRQTAIRSIWKGYCRYPASQQHKNEEWTVEELTTVLHFDDDEQTIQYCEEQDLEFTENAQGNLYLNWGSRPVDSVAFQPSSDHSFSEKYVESKRAGRNLVAIILGLSIKEAASLGMIDSSLLFPRSLARPATGLAASSNDESLFVSDDDNEMGDDGIRSPAIQTDTNAQDPIFTQPPASASSLRNGLKEVSKSTASAETTPTQSNFAAGFSISQASSTAQRSEPTKTFSSLFSGGSPAAAPIAPAPAPALANPFANVASQFTASKPPVAEQRPITFPSVSSGQQGTSTFIGGISNLTPNPLTTPGPSAPQSESPSPFQPSITPSSSPFSSTSTTSIFKQASTSTAGQTSAGLFNTSKAFSTSEVSSSSVFNLAGQQTSLEKPQDEKPQPIFSKPAEPISAPSFPFTQAQNPFAPVKNATPSVFSPAESTNGFAFAQPVDIKTVQKPPKISVDPKIGDSKVLERESIFAPIASTSEPMPSAVEAITEQHQPDSIITQAGPPALEFFSSPHEIAKSQAPDYAKKEHPISAEPATTEDEALSSESDSRRLAWLETLQKAADLRRQQFSAGRKRVFNEAETEPIESEPKAPKISKPEAPTPKKVSMALSSTKPLPKLPILEKIEAMTARKPVKEEKLPPPKPSQVDEDELLLSAARIAAESLRSGPSLLDHWSTYPETRTSAFSPHSSLSSSHSFSRSQSPHSYHVHGYDVALAPDRDLGLGRTLSRTEQRIRLTGGKGLAYKPLIFTPEKPKKAQSKK